MFQGLEIFHNIRKEWIEQVIWKTKKTQFLYAVNQNVNTLSNNDKAHLLFKTKS